MGGDLPVEQTAARLETGLYIVIEEEFVRMGA